MGSRYLTDLDQVLRQAGLQVATLSGWQTRARSSGGYDGAPWCVMWHHTASNGNGANDANWGTFSSPDRPIANIYIGQDAVCHVAAAGATNTNGRGGPIALPDGRTVPADGMNTRAIGVELSNNGTGMPYPQAQIDAAFVASVACCRAYINGRVDNVAGHWDWAPSRKIDPATGAGVQGPWTPRTVTSSGTWSLADLRSECIRRAAGPGPLPDPEEDSMYLATLATGTIVVVGSAVRPVSAEELSGPFAALEMARPDPSSFWHAWLVAGADEYSRRMGMA